MLGLVLRARKCPPLVRPGGGHFLAAMLPRRHHPPCRDLSVGFHSPLGFARGSAMNHFTYRCLGHVHCPCHGRARYAGAMQVHNPFAALLRNDRALVLEGTYLGCHASEVLERRVRATSRRASCLGLRCHRSNHNPSFGPWAASLPRAGMSRRAPQRSCRVPSLTRGLLSRAPSPTCGRPRKGKGCCPGLWGCRPWRGSVSRASPTIAEQGSPLLASSGIPGKRRHAPPVVRR